MRRKRGIFLIGAVLLFATASVVYAHWQETLTVDGTVSMGSANIVFGNRPHTDDDHIDDAWEGVRETAAQEGTDFDRWPGTSSNDPSAPIAATRSTKDVGRCRVTAWTAESVTAVVDNAYPSYWCTIRDTNPGYRNAGSVPMKDQALRVEVCEADCSDPANWVDVPYDTATDRFWYDGDADTAAEIEFANRPQNWCGRQIDPNATIGWQVWLHVLPASPAGSTYQVRFASEWVNWNEWDRDDCSGYDEWGNGSGSQKFPIP